MTRKSRSKPKLTFLQNGVAQVALIVKDLDKTVEHYWNDYGIGPWHFYTYGKPLVKKMSYHGEPAEYKMRVALSWIGSLRIELIEVLEGPTVYADFVKEHGSPTGRLQESRSRVGGAGERSSLMPEQFTFEQRVGQRDAVQAQERATRTR